MKTLLIGTGYMAREYVPVLKNLSAEIVVVGNSAESVDRFNEETGINDVPGGISAFLQNEECSVFDNAIVTVPTVKLADVTGVLLDAGIKKILVEKPGGISAKELGGIREKSKENSAEVYVAYNRRFYASTIAAKNIIEKDGGARSFNFEFTEWSHIIEHLKKDSKVKKEWFLVNSSHVVDLAFYLGGKPQEIATFTSGSSRWHPRAMIYAGAGRAENGVLFSYCANWSAPGRWSVEVLTERHRLIFRPLEKLKIQEIGSVEIKDVVIDDALDLDFKPGLYNQVKSFFGGCCGLKTIEEQLYDFSTYKKMEDN